MVVGRMVMALGAHAEPLRRRASLRSYTDYFSTPVGALTRRRYLIWDTTERKFPLTKEDIPGWFHNLIYVFNRLLSSHPPK